MNKDLLLEIGTEEIPAGYIPPALEQLKNLANDSLTEERIEHKDIFTYGTPRRLVLYVKEVALRQKDWVTEVVGPPKNVSFDAQGNPTKAAIGFAKSQMVKVEELRFKETSKGIYICAHKTLQGKETKDVLACILPKIIKSISFPKSMYWKDKTLYFARPVRWILALLGGTKIEFEFAGINSDNLSYGHRFLSKQAIKINYPSEYEEKLRENFVIVDQVKRRKMILDEIKSYCENQNCIAPQLDELLDEVVYLVEYPALIFGNFNKEYLGLPHEVLVAAMREHQRYFHIVDKENNFLPNFLVIANTNPEIVSNNAISIIREGNERVLAARLADASFFFNQDKKISLESRVEEEKERIWQEDVGTVYEKTQRLVKLADFISQKIAPELTNKAARAALLCKADLSTEMVGEFPKLQGIMGYYYALASGEGEDVAKAICEHYLPTSSDGVLPQTLLGSIVSLSDKIDSIVSCFSVGLIPTGSQDPYALRRQAQGIINILSANFFKVPSTPPIPPLSLQELVDYSLILLDKKVKRDRKIVTEEVLNFLNQRLQNILINGIQSGAFSHSGIVNTSQAQALLEIGVDDIEDALQKALALSKISRTAEFEPLIIAFKRVMNILKPVTSYQLPVINEKLLVEESEKKLYTIYRIIKEELHTHLIKKEYSEYLTTLIQFRQPIDEFFDEVMVMVEDKDLKGNRLALLSNISSLFLKIANFSYIENR
ncbi:MAG: glycine--tRNA ligase subunit beta [bacterium]